MKKKLKTLDSRNFSYFKALIYAFFSKKLYIDVGLRWRGFGFLYLLLLVAVGLMPYSIKNTLIFDKYFHNLETVISKVPKFYVQNGKLFFDKKMPYIIRDNQGFAEIIVDNTGEVTSFDAKYPKLKILITKHQIMQRVFPPLIGIYDAHSAPSIFSERFPPTMNTVFDNGTNWLKNSQVKLLKTIVLILVYPMLVAFAYTLIISLLLLFSFMGQIFSSLFFDFKISFKQACRLLAVSSTCAFSIICCLLALQATLPHSGIIISTTLIFYFYLAILSVKSASKKLAL